MENIMSDQVDGTPDLSEVVSRAMSAARAAEEASQKANSEAGFAFNAKGAAEEHARAISEIKGRAESDAAWFTTTRQGIEQTQATVVAIRADLEAAQRTSTEALAEIEKLRTSTKAAASEVAERLEEARTQRDQAADASKAAAQHTASAAEHKNTSEAAAKRVTELLAQVTEAAEKVAEQAEQVSENATGVDAAAKTAKTLVESMGIADKKAADILNIIQAHEADLARLKTECDTLHARIEGLLPNATSAGLATAFRDQKARFRRPQLMWLVTFVATIVLLLVSAYVGLPSANDPWDTIGRHFVNRLPLIAPLIWLAIYAGRHYGLALRLQEEYAYKEAVSAAFEGYKREMGSVGGTGSAGANPLVTLCENVLRTLGQRPGRIYEGKHEDITVLTPVAHAVREGVEAASGGVKKLAAPAVE
ncbi:MAG TPA: hypothetical protein VHA82_23960 [Ramlibacter sp.]|uniref:hypothetical protein n=1 Tax=Ramlibacter sp. TaxID=1917967 RepID=UPI002C163E5E|nr:hypothetical protein [Ramlibacter sp.]HVZ46883.1 hypothetical protein [Ramlibacter sp.]